jgi:hypothetical protein
MAIILGGSLIVATLIHAYSNRNTLTNNKMGRIDKWKGIVVMLKAMDE